MINAYELLGIGPGASRADLEAAYAEKLASYAPERVAGLGHDFESIAEQRRALLRSAYHALRPALASARTLESAVERRRDWQTIWALLTFVTIALGLVAVRDIAPPQRTVTVGGAEAAAKTAQIAPNFTMSTVDGRRINLTDFQGKVVLVNIWATWCPPCVREIPRLQRTFEAYRDQGFVLIGMNTTFQDDQAKVAKFVADQGITYPVALDTEGVGARDYAGRLMPTSYLINRSGKIVSVQVGEVDEAKLKEQIAALLKQ